MAAASLEFAAWGALIVVIFASAPFLFDLDGRSVHGVYDKRAVWLFLCRFFLLVGDRKNTAASALPPSWRVSLSWRLSVHRKPGPGSLVAAIQSVLNAINGLIKRVELDQSVRTTISNLYQQATWPIALINQAKGYCDADDRPIPKRDAEHLHHQLKERHPA